MKFAASLTSLEELDKLDAHSSNGEGVLIYKHSTRCFISTMAQRRLAEWDQEKMPIYYLDLLRYREVSNEVAKRYHVIHQSPQLILIKDGKRVADASHEGISADVISSWLNND